MPNPVDFHPLSGAATGLGLVVVATATPGTLVHTTGISATVFDEPTLTAMNTDTADRELTIEFGGVAAGNLIKQTIPFKAGETLVLSGVHALCGTGAAGREIRAFCAAAASVIVLYGSINRISGVS